MTNNLTLLMVTAFYTALLAGAGTLVSYGLLPDASLLKRFSLRFILGAALAPTVSIALHEIAGIKVHPATAFALGGFGLALLIREEWLRARKRAAAIKAAEAAAAEAGAEEVEESDVEFAGRLESLEDVVLLLMMAGVFFTCFVAGTQYPMMEGWDPWGHALGTQYILDTGSLRQPFKDYPLIHYVDAYPPLYDVLMSLPCGLAGSINAPLKTTNALFVAAVIPAFYLLARCLTGDRRLAMVAAILYAVIPSNLTRHVWGHSAAMAFTLAGLACAIRSREAWRWIGPGALCFAGALLAAPTAGIKAGALLTLTAAVTFFINRPWFFKVVALGALALAIALIWYGPVFQRYGTDINTLKAAMDGPLIRHRTADAISAGKPEAVPHPHFEGASARYYNLDDFLFFRPYKKILELTQKKVNSHIVPLGLGLPIILFGLVFLALCAVRWVRGPERIGWRELLLAWIVFALIGVLGRYTHFEFFIWRFWLLLVPFTLLAAADGLLFLADRCSRSMPVRITFMLLGFFAFANAACALYFDATSIDQSPWSSFRDGYPFFAVVLGGILWLLAYGATLDGAEELAFRLAAGVVLLDCIIAAPMRVQKLTHPTTDHIFTSSLEYEGYIRTYFKTEPGARIWPMAGEYRFQIIVGLDRSCDFHKKEDLEFYLKLEKHPEKVSSGELVSWLRENHYEYVVFDPVYENLLTEEKVDEKVYRKRIDDLLQMPQDIELVMGLPKEHQTQHFFLFKVLTKSSEKAK